MVKKDIVVVADLGAAGNLVRNLLLLSNQIEWPMHSSRFDTIFKQYSQDTKLEKWLEVEARLRFWQQYYGVDISNDINIDKFKDRKQKTKPVVYLNHSAFYQHQQFNQLKNIVDILFVAPTTEFGIQWQVRSYCEKKTIEKMHNFTFQDNVEQQRRDYCDQHGVDAYDRLNITNFKEILCQRQTDFGIPDLRLEQLLCDSAESIVASLNLKLNINVDVEQAEQIILAWRNLHWPIEQTTQWKYYD